AGRSVAEAFLEIYYLERACQAQIAALSGGAKLIFPPVAVQEHTARQFNPPEPYLSAHCKMAWQSALRLIANSGSDYRT
ncbi:MAG: class II aldolase, partial [Acidocella sp. 35-58-6]